MEIKSLTNQQITFENNEYVINMGAIKQGKPTIKLLIEDSDIEHLGATSSCQCTEPEVKKVDKGLEMSVSYNARRKANFTQTVTERINKNGKEIIVIFKLKGTVI